MSVRNVLLLIADDWSPMAGCYGHDWLQTPNVDRFAEHATRFNNAFCTSPSCAVSRACILTGQHSHTHGQYGHCHGHQGFRTHEHLPSLNRVLQFAGYRVGHIGKCHTAPESVYPVDFRVDKADYDVDVPATVSDRMQAFFKQTGDQPFFLHVAGLFPHRRGGARFGIESVPDGIQDVRYDPDSVHVPDFLPDTPETRLDLADYYTAVSRWDQFVGTVLDGLERAGHAEDTLVLLCSDHGMPFPGGKASSFDTGHRCPLLIRDPEVGTAQATDALASWVDLMPTVLDRLGVAPPAGLVGHSLMPAVRDAATSVQDAIYFSHNFHEVVGYDPYRVIRTATHKLTLNLAPELPTPIPSDLFRSPTWQAVRAGDLDMMGRRPTQRFLHSPAVGLYDIVNDPVEAHNLADAPEHAGLRDDLFTRLDAMREATGDPWLELSFQRFGGANPVG